jgi:hypothetical protein
LTINFTKNVAIPNLTSQYVPSTCRCFKFWIFIKLILKISW